MENRRKVCCLSWEMDLIQVGDAVAVVVAEINTWIWICTLTRIYLFYDVDEFCFLFSVAARNLFTMGYGVNMMKNAFLTILYLLIVLQLGATKIMVSRKQSKSDHAKIHVQTQFFIEFINEHLSNRNKNKFYWISSTKINPIISLESKLCFMRGLEEVHEHLEQNSRLAYKFSFIRKSDMNIFLKETFAGALQTCFNFVENERWTSKPKSSFTVP